MSQANHIYDFLDESQMPTVIHCPIEREKKTFDKTNWKMYAI